MSISPRRRGICGIFARTATFLLCAVLTPKFLVTADKHPNIYIEPFETYINETIEVKARQYVHYALQLNEGTTLHAGFVVSGGSNNKADIWLLDSSNYQLFLNSQQFRYFEGTSGSVRGVSGYSFTIPQTDTYELIIDNRRATKYSRIVSLYVYGVFPGPTPESEEYAKEFQQVYDGFKKLFIFKDFTISFRHCGVENAFSDPNITICIELIEALGNQNLADAAAYIIFHELGHTLLRDWDLPLWDNEDVQDEFAVVICLLAEIKQSALAAAQFWAGNPSRDEALSKIYLDDRHAVSPQRARNIVRWINDPDELLRRWQKMLIPNMQTEALKELDKETDPWINHELIKSELKRR